MKNFREGTFNRESLGRSLQPFCPVTSSLSLSEISLQGLYDRGKRLVLLDVDNTLTHWKSNDIIKEGREWVETAKALGMNVCLVSNTNRPKRLLKLTEELGISRVTGRAKPSRNMFLKALEMFNATPDQAVMIGDQLFTDVLGANRSGIESIWVRPLTDVEFFGTKVNRWLERRLLAFLYNALEIPVDIIDDPSAAKQHLPLWQRAIFLQFIKFGIVGGTCFAIDAGLSYLLMAKVSWNGGLLSASVGGWLVGVMPFLNKYYDTPSHAAAVVFFPFASLVATYVSFILNRSWTFSIRGQEERAAQLKRFMVIAIIGLILNSVIAAGLVAVFSGSTAMRTLLAKASAAVIVAVWNFAGQRLYAFKPRSK